jgi:hypothetical protein
MDMAHYPRAASRLLLTFRRHASGCPGKFGYPAAVQTLFLILKIVGALIAGTFLLAALFIGVVLIRKSGLFVLRSDLVKFAAGVCRDAEVATALCGAPAELIIGAERPPGSWPPYVAPEVALSSWRLWFPMSGTLEARVAGVGARHTMPAAVDDRVVKVSERRCEGIIRFGYRFHWDDNGRSVGLGSEVVGKTVVIARR